jgi:hypothetical protein
MNAIRSKHRLRPVGGLRPWFPFGGVVSRTKASHSANIAFQPRKPQPSFSRMR